MSDEKTQVKVLSDDEKKLVVQTADGGEKTYYLNPQRLMELRVESAQVTKTASSPDTSWFWMPTFATQGVPDRVPALTELRLLVVGNAELEDGRRIGIIGEPGKESRPLHVCFYSPDDESRERREDSLGDKSTPHQWAAPWSGFHAQTGDSALTIVGTSSASCLRQLLRRLRQRFRLASCSV